MWACNVSRGVAREQNLKYFTLQSEVLVPCSVQQLERGSAVKIWWKRARAAMVMGVLWAGGGFAIGGLIELLDNVLPGGLSFASRVDMWPQTLAIPGFIGGLIFAVIVMVAGGHSHFHALSLRRFAGWGALAGSLLGVLALGMGAPLAFIGITASVGAIGGTVSLLLARMANRRELLGAPDPPSVPVVEGEVLR